MRAVRHLRSSVLRVSKSAFLWAVVASATTAFVSTSARALCLPPYWPHGPVFRCRPEMTPALLHIPLDAAITGLILLVPAVGIGLAVQLLLLVLRGRLQPAARWLAAIVGGVLWFVLVARFEPSPLDFIISGYATAAGAVASGLLVLRTRPEHTLVAN